MCSYRIYPNSFKYDSVAQLVEQMTLNHWVVGSSPTGVTQELKSLDFSSFFVNLRNLKYLQNSETLRISNLQYWGAISQFLRIFGDCSRDGNGKEIPVKKCQRFFIGTICYLLFCQSFVMSSSDLPFVSGTSR